MEKESGINRDSFVFYRSFYEAIHELKDDIKLEVFTAITEYALNGKVPEDMKPVAKGMFALIKPNLDANTSRYKNGKKGGRKSSKIDKTDKPDKTKKSPSSPVDPTSFSSFEEEAEQMKSGQVWCETICKQFHIDQDELNRRLDSFTIHCKIEREDELHPSIKDARRHFTSWMRKAYPAAVVKSNKQSNPDDYSFKGGFGGLDT